MKIEVAVADAGPLHYLALINQAGVLGKLFGKVFVPEAVLTELQHPNTPVQIKTIINSRPDWLQFQAVRDPSKVSTFIDRGEAEAIQLAMEVHAQTILIDDSQGRKFARALGLATLGTVGILEAAAAINAVDLSSALSALRRTNIFLAESIFQPALTRHEFRRGKRGSPN